MKEYFILSLYILVCSNSYSNVEEDHAICGEKPTNPALEKEMLEKARFLERTMPPISNQNPASWCYAFAATDALNYHNYLQTNQQTKAITYSEFYQDKNMISPIEVVHAHNSYRRKNTPTNTEPEGHIDMKVGGNATYAYSGIQMFNFEMRSREQINFNALEKSDPKTRARLQNIVKKYKEKNGQKQELKNYTYIGVTCPASLYESQSFKKQLEGFEQINEWVSKTAEANNLRVNNYSINNYTGISQLKGQKDINVFPFVANDFAGNLKINYLKKMRTVLYPALNISKYGSPATVGLCAYDIESKATANDSSSDNCGAHVVNVVGAFYENGKCMIRIRNTWGADWNGDGHKSLPLDTFLKAVENRNKNLTNKYQLSWLTPDKKYSQDKILKASMCDDTGITTLGTITRTFKSNNSGQYSYTWKNQRTIK